MPKLTRRPGILAALASLLVMAAVAAIAVAAGGPKTDKAQASFTATKASTGKLGDGGGANTAVIQTGRCSGGDAPGHARKPAKTPQPEQVKHPEQS